MRGAAAIVLTGVLAACGTPAGPPVAAPERAAPDRPPVLSPGLPAAACAPPPAGTVQPCYDTGTRPPVRPLAVVNSAADLVRLPTTVHRAVPAVASVEVRVEHPDGCQQLRGAFLAETADAVTVYAVGTAPPAGPCVLRLATGTYRVELSAPLGARTVSTVPR